MQALSGEPPSVDQDEPARLPGRLAGAPLLATKLFTPRARDGLVARPRLVERLGDPSRRNLTLVSAPAGYGKTTLVVEWLGQVSSPATWLTLDEADNDPVRFLTYLIAALRRVEPRAGRATTTLLSLPQLPAVEALVAPLVNDLAAGPHFALVLDDYHAIRTQLIHEVVEYLLTHQPPSVHVVLITRRDPPFPMARLRALGQVLEVRAGDLRFSPDEAEAFLTSTMGLRLSPRSIGTLGARTEGWPAGLQLAALSLQGRDDAEAFVADFGGSDRYVVDYLAEEVLRQQPEEVRAFLQRTAVLDRFSAPLCDALTGRDDGAAILARLDRSNLFLIPLDGRREWYRYHQLFADVLRADLDPATARHLHRTAAAWLETHGRLSEAITAALAGEEYPTAGRLVGAAAVDALRQGEYVTLRRWLDALPPDLVRADADLASYRAWALFLVGQLAEAERLARECIAALPSDASLAGRGRLLSLLAWFARYREQEDAITLAEEALALLGGADPFFRMLTLLPLGKALGWRDSDAALRTYEEALALAEALGSPFAIVATLLSLFPELNWAGRRRDAEALCRRLLAEHASDDGEPLPLAAVVFVPLGVVLYEADRVEEAHDLLTRGLAAYRELRLERHPIGDGLWVLAKAKLALGQTEEALEVARRLRALAEPQGFATLGAIALSLEAEIRLSRGEVELAARALEPLGLSAAVVTPQREREHLTLARVLLAEGQVAKALSLLDRLQHLAEEGRRNGRLIAVLAVKARALQLRGDRAGAIASLTRAVELAAPEGYRRVFLDEGLGDLLPEARSAAPTFVDELLAARGERTPTIARAAPKGSAEEQGPRRADGLAEPLSEREREILRLIAAGNTNAEIAERLVISLSTAKWHAYNLFGKLGVKSRTQAIARARELGLLDAA